MRSSAPASDTQSQSVAESRSVDENRPANDPEVTVSVARNFDEVVMALTLRGVTYLGEQEAPFEEEYDGNDLVAAAHLVARIEGEPAGVLRVRFFAGFAKVERAAVLKRFREHGVMRVLMQEGLRYCARRGYRSVLGHAQTNRLAYWRTHGFRPRQGRPPFWFSDYEYVEIERRLNPPSDAITIDTDPMVVIRPDGEWDDEGPFDKSLDRLPPGMREGKDVEAA